MPPARTTRSTRAGASRLTATNSTSASITRQPSDAHHLRITVKAPPSKLRQAISGDDPESDYPQASETPEPPARSARSTRNPRTVLDNESDDDLDEDDDDEDAEGDEDDIDNTEMMDAEGSDDDADADGDDLDMDEHPSSPVIRVAQPNSRPNPSISSNIIVAAPPNKGNLKSVEAKELEDEDDDDDDELSDLESGDEEIPVADEDDEELDSDLELGDGDATPDMTKLTRRQRAAFEEETDNSLMALSNEAQKKKHLTAEEHAMRRAEMARRRKNLSEKRNEEEKVRPPTSKLQTFADQRLADGHHQQTPQETCTKASHKSRDHRRSTRRRRHTDDRGRRGILLPSQPTLRTLRQQQKRQPYWSSNGMARRRPACWSNTKERMEGSAEDGRGGRLIPLLVKDLHATILLMTLT